MNGDIMVLYEVWARRAKKGDTKGYPGEDGRPDRARALTRRERSFVE